MNQADVYHYNRSYFSAGNIVARDLVNDNVNQVISILDLGCNKGYWGQRFKEKCSCVDLFGVDYDQGSIDVARPYYKEVYCADLNIDRLSKYSFPQLDYVLFMDVLEHLVDPMQLLEQVRELLKPEGCIYVSLPNVAYFIIRLNLLMGRFDYTQSGILDRTHLHLYTRKSAVQLLNKAGFSVDKIFYSGDYLGGLTKCFPFLGPLFGFNIILRAGVNQS